MIDALHPYPVEWIDRWQLSDGRSVTVRPVLPQDLDLEHDFVATGLTQRSRHLRFQVGVRELPPSVARYFTDIDYHDHFALIAESFEGEHHVQVGDARFVRDAAAAHTAEFGIAVADAWQGLGLGQRLLQSLIAAARAHQVTQLYGDVLRDNAPMLALVGKQGFAARRHPEDARLLRVERTLELQGAPEAERAPRSGSPQWLSTLSATAAVSACTPAFKHTMSPRSACCAATGG
jgi:acetyltransferase